MHCCVQAGGDQGLGTPNGQADYVMGRRRRCTSRVVCKGLHRCRPLSVVMFMPWACHVMDALGRRALSAGRSVAEASCNIIEPGDVTAASQTSRLSGATHSAADRLVHQQQLTMHASTSGSLCMQLDRHHWPVLPRVPCRCHSRARAVAPAADQRTQKASAAQTGQLEWHDVNQPLKWRVSTHMHLTKSAHGLQLQKQNIRAAVACCRVMRRQLWLQVLLLALYQHRGR